MRLSAFLPSRWSRLLYARNPHLTLLAYESARSIAEAEPIEPDYVVERLLIRGAITLFSAKIKTGKTTFTGCMLRSIYSGEPTIGFRTKQSRGIYCTEEGRRTFRSFLSRVGLDDREDLDVVFLNEVNREISWRSIVTDVLARAIETKASFVIFDTLTRWARIPPDKEADPGTAAAVMEELEYLRAANIAVVAVFHDRKMGGEIEDSQRGSSAFGGAADILLQLRNPRSNGHPSRRIISSVGRFDDPGEWTIEYNAGVGSYEMKSEGASPEGGSTKVLLQLEIERTPMSRPDISKRFPKISRSTVDDALNDLVRDQVLTRSGRGVRSDPFVYSVSSV